MIDRHLATYLHHGMAHARLMGVLGRRGLEIGSYADETPCSMEWCQVDTERVLEAIENGEDLYDALTDTGWWNSDDGPLPDSIRDELLEAART